MDTIETLKQDVREGRISAERLVDLVVDLSRKLEAANQRIEELQKQCGGTPTAKVDEPFSMRAEEKRQEARGKKKRKRKPKGRRGRVSTADKVAQAERTEAVYPAGVSPDACRLSHVRPVWRLEQRRAVLVAYQIYRGPGNRYGQIPGVLGRSEFGIELMLAIAYQVYVVGLSFDKVCLLLAFFVNLKLGKSQAEALLKQLARRWEKEFDVLCLLLAHSLLVQTDETSWSIRSVWVFLSEKVRVLCFGVRKDADTLREILDLTTFAGILISDDAAVYANFKRSQKCWAHLLRKAIKLTLMDPTNAEYRQFLDRLLEIYHAACRVRRDGRLGVEGRQKKVTALENEVFDLCIAMWAAELPPSQGLENDYRLLCNELMRLMLADQLFTFVTAEPVPQPNGGMMAVPGTNNESERTLRSPAEARNTRRTSKTPRGARRRTVITSVLESLRNHLATFTLSSVIEEVRRWYEGGRSCFARLAEELGLTIADSPSGGRSSVLDRVLPVPDG